MRNFKKTLAWLLALMMALSMLPLSALATEPAEEADAEVNAAQTVLTETQDAETQEESSTFYKIVHLDCGRKYFTKDWIIALLYEMQYDGYNQLELAFGNDGLRFLLDDMSFTANGTTYAHDDVVSAVKAGNETQNSSGDASYLTQKEMDEIISTAKTLGIEIVPLLNLPGHANTILDIAGDAYNYKTSSDTSSNTLDVTNESAVNFAMAIFQKYVDYFAGKGCKFFNFGADEYANDILKNSFAGLSGTEYNSYVAFINKLAAYVEDKGMTPRAFNDGLYYGTYTSVTIDTKIQCCYWSSGWSGYNVASADTIKGKGHAMINTNGDYYYVLGKDDAFTPDKTTTHSSDLYTVADGFSNTAFMGSTINNPVGSMFCIWCDYPNAETETEIAKNVRLTLRAMAARMKGEDISTIDTGVVVSHGFNADGTINKSVTISGATNVAIGGTATLTLSSGEDATWASSDTSVLTVSAAETGTEAASETSEVTGKSVVITGVSAGTATVTATLSDDSTVTANITVTTDTEITADETVNLTIGSSETVTQSGSKTIDESVTTDGSIATVSVSTTASEKTTLSEDGTYELAISDGTNYVVVDSSGKISNTTNATEATVFTVVRSTSSGYYNTTTTYTFYANGYYLTIEKSGNGNNASYSLKMSTSSSSWYLNDSYGYYQSLGYSTTRYICYDSGWGTGSNQSGHLGQLYTLPSTSITFTGVSVGTTYAKVGDVIYEIIVDYNRKTISLVKGTGTATDTQTKEIAKGTVATITGDNVVTVTYEGSTVTFTAKDTTGTATVTLGDTVYTVKVTEEDLSNAKSLTIEYWITNRQVTANGATSMSLSATDAYGESGVKIADLVPSEGTYGSDTEVYWKTTKLDSNHQQTTDSGDDETQNGTDFTYIRYYGDSWAVSADGTTWKEVASTDQIVAYYLQKTTVTSEVITEVVDWGYTNSSWSSLNSEGQKYVLLDYTVKYEDGTESPSTWANANSLGFHCNPGTTDTSTNVNYRTIGMTRAEETNEYEVYMITVTPTSDYATTYLSGSTAAENSSYSYGGTETVVWAATEEDYENSGLGKYTSISGAYTYKVGGEPIVPGLEIYQRHGMKVTYYIRAKKTEDSLTVRYVDQTTGEEFYSYNIAVYNGTYFDENIALANPWKANLTNGTVINKLSVTQTVSADLSTMPAIGAQYRCSDYTCVKVERSSDGKTVTLYYTFSNTKSFVVDFGLPLTITAADLGLTGTDATWTVSNGTYGKAAVGTDKTITYTPNKTFTGVDAVTLTQTVTDTTKNTTSAVSYQIYIYPATTVYYEEGFATYSENWTSMGNTGSNPQTTTVADKTGDTITKDDLYGYDNAYNTSTVGASNGTQATSTETGDTATFSFTGTGVEIYTNNTTTTGAVMVTLKTSGGTIQKVFIVDTHMAIGDTEATSGQAVEAYNVPIVRATGLTYGDYEVVIRHVAASSTETSIGAVNIDGFRVYGTCPETKDDETTTAGEIYAADLEDNPSFIELRDELLGSIKISGYTGKYASEIAETALAQVYNSTNETNITELLIDGTNGVTENSENKIKFDLLENGPKNEIYLQKGQSLVFAVTTKQEVQLGVKALNATTTYTIQKQVGETTSYVKGTAETNAELNASTDMFYRIGEKPTSGTETTTTYTVTNTGNGILSVTLLKICDDPNASLVALTADDLIPALVSLGFEEEPKDATATLTVTAQDYRGQTVATATLTANGAEGSTHTFTAAEISEAVAAVLPDGYAIVEAEAAADVTVTYGTSETTAVLVGRTATLNVTYVNVRGQTVGTATLTAVQDGYSRWASFSASEIRAAGPEGYRVLWLTTMKMLYGSTMNLRVVVY